MFTIRLVQRIGFRNLLCAGLLISAVVTVTAGLVSMVENVNQGTLWITSLTGVID